METIVLQNGDVSAVSVVSVVSEIHTLYKIRPGMNLGNDRNDGNHCPSERRRFVQRLRRFETIEL